MTAITTSIRPRMYDIPHKGLRNALAHFSLLAGNTDYRNSFAIAKLHRLGHEVFTMLDEHAEGENSVLLAELETRHPGAGRHNFEDHDLIEQQQTALTQSLDTLLALSKNGADLRLEGERFFHQINQFYSAYIQHMLEEEEETQAELWAYFTDEELADLTRRIISKIPPDVMLLWVKWSMPALPHTERTTWMRAMKAGAPAPFFAQVLATVEQVLPPLDLEMLLGEL